MSVFKFFLIISIIISITSCQTDIFHETENTQSTEPEYNNVDERLWPYFRSFENEAALRGISIDLNAHRTTGEISPIPEDGVAGSCQYGSHINHVTIDLNFWNNRSHLIREFVIYHELGHCVLDRDHEESSFDNGICRSIMRSGLEDCNDAYNQQNRTYFVDELFSTTANLDNNESTIL